ncbi:oligomeric, coiled-coil, peripheral membrane protein [Mortierella polycephala]|uniref:Autophagy-related protein 11 n=1 Tax=Mortierella polycephala TaxID=41804 RepID=A0A9P6U822_9FUNG|nr:oligomeric, coiled-coil, peripheral membrane protein [Mortierella polycephala]
MKLYRAETGKRVLIPQLRPNDGLETLRLAIEKATRIPQGSQILMTSEGLQLKPDMMFEAITSTGKDEYTIMVYNREVLTTDISSSMLTLTEQARTEPPITPLSTQQLQIIALPSRPESPSGNREWGSQFQRTFEAYVAHVMAYYKAIVANAGICERIMEELRMQSLAVQVALTNLDAHSRSVLETFEKFNVFAVKELTKQARLLQSFPRDIETLRQIKVHPALLPANSPERYISDFIPTEKLILWAERCREIHEGLQRDGRELSRSIKEVQEGTVAIRSNSGINLDQLEEAMTEILQTVEQQSRMRHRVEIDQNRVKERLTEISRPAGFAASTSTLEALVQLATVYTADYMDSSQHADEMLRDKLSIFLSAKRSQTANLISQLMHISRLQSTIASIPPSLGSLDDSLRKRDTDFSQLVYVQRIPIAYGALVVEIVRRREYSKLLLQKSQQLAEVMSRFRQMEQRRRDSFRSEVAKFVPVVVPGLDDEPPFCEINALNTQNRLPPFTREHVAEFERLVNQLSMGPGGHDGNESHLGNTDQSGIGNTSFVGSTQETGQDALSKLRVTLGKMTAQMDIMGGEFDKFLERSFLSERTQRLEEENARLRADMSRADVQQRVGTPQLGSHRGTGGSIGPGSTTVAGTVGMSVATPTSPKLSRQPSRGSSSSTPAGLRMDTEEQQHILQQQVQQNQRLTKENTEMSNKIKAYENRIRSLEETLYRNYGASSGVDSSLSSKDSRQQQPISPGSEQPWVAYENVRPSRNQSQAMEQGRKCDEERILMLEQELEDLSKKLEQTEAKLRDEYNASQQALSVNDELRQELLELKLLSATLDGSSDVKPFEQAAMQNRAEELEEELRGMTLKCEHLLQHHQKETDLQSVETKAFKDRIEELTNQLALEKEILEGQLDQARRTAEEACEKVMELEDELELVKDVLQNKIVELEEVLENHNTEHKDLATRAQEQERQLKSHRAVHNDILAQLKDQEQKTAVALQDGKTAKEEHATLQENHVQLVKDHETLTKTLAETTGVKDELVQQVETLHKQLSELEAQREAYKNDVDVRLEKAKTMLQRAEEDWKEKSRLLDQMERAIKNLSKPIKGCLDALGVDHTVVEIDHLDHARDKIQEIGNRIQDLTSRHDADQAAALKGYDARVSELHNDHEMSREILNSTIAMLKKARQVSEEDAVVVKAEMGSAIDRLKEELENIKIQQRASGIPVLVSTTPLSETALASTSPETLMHPSLPTGHNDVREQFSVSDRLLLGILALDLGIPLPLLSAANDQQDVMSPSSSVLLDNSERRPTSASSIIMTGTASAPTPTAVTSSTSGSSRSSGTTVPLPKDALKTLDFSDLNVAETTALIKKKLFDTEHLLKRWQRECKHLKEKYNRAMNEAHEKIAFRNFKVDDLTLFLPTRNSISKPWAAFNINFPHYFLQMTPTMANQLKNREWIVARITSITERVVDKRYTDVEGGDDSNGSSSNSNAVSAHNPFGLADGVKYYLLEATSWTGHHSHSKSSSYHSSSIREGSSSGRLRHHASTSALYESSSSARRDRERRKDRDTDVESRKHAGREEGRSESSGAHLRTVREDQLTETASDAKANSSAIVATMNPSFTSTSVVPSSVSNPSLLNLLQSTSDSHRGATSENQMNQATVATTATAAASIPGTGGRAVDDTSKAAASLQHTQSQIMKQKRHESRSSPSSLDGSHVAHVQAAVQAGPSAGNRASIDGSSSAPISIPYQSPAANALRAISSSVGSTGSGGSGSISSLLAHQLGGGSGSGSGAATAVAASSPPRTLLTASSPHKTGVSTVSAVGTTVSVNSINAGGHGLGHSHSNSQGGSSPVIGSASNVPVHPSRLSTSSNRDDLEQLAVFATDEDQEEDRERQQQQEQQQQQRGGFHRTSSSTSTWHGL